MDDDGLRAACPVSAALSTVADRQSLLVVREVLLGNTRFSGIRARTGLSRDVLADRLARLVELDVLLQRPVSAKRLEYVPTAAGRDLLPVLLALGQWAVRHLPLPAEGAAWEPALLAVAHDVRPAG